MLCVGFYIFSSFFFSCFLSTLALSFTDSHLNFACTSPRMGAFGKVRSGSQFTHLEGGTIWLTEFRGPFQMRGSPFTSFPAPFQDHFLHNSQRYACGYIYLSIYLSIYMYLFLNIH